MNHPYNTWRSALIVLIWSILAESCAAMPPNEAAKTTTVQQSQRFHDAPPTVEPNRYYQLPVDTKIALAGGYGELRPNHFHAGLDFKTDQTIGHPVYAFADGFVRRAAINAYGYGLVLYVQHDTLGLTSVYAHLDSFDEKIMQVVRRRQVKEELNNCDITFAPGEIPVKQGEVIALSGNTGSSAGPHVHFELRNIPSDDDDICYDPQAFFLHDLLDTEAPHLTQVYLYPQAGEGVANGSSERQAYTVEGVCARTGGKGGQLTRKPTAWGRVGLGIKAYDYMNGQSNRLGVKEVRLYQIEGNEQRLIYHFKQDAFRFSESRFTNSVTDFGAWNRQRSMIMKSFIEPANYLQQVDPSVGDGLVDIREERPYHFRYELCDAHGNVTTLSFTVDGVSSPIAPARQPAGTVRVGVHQPLSLDTLGMQLTGQADVFYTAVDLPLRITDYATTIQKEKVRHKNRKGRWVTTTRNVEVTIPTESKVYEIGNDVIPMHTYCHLRIRVPHPTSHKLYLTDLDNDKGGAVHESRYVAASGSQPAYVEGEIREGGRYCVRKDERSPVVSLQKATWEKMSLDIDDDESGIASFKVKIDGQFVPFDKNRSGRYFAEPCYYGISYGEKHTIDITVTDRVGNTTHEVFERQF